MAERITFEQNVGSSVARLRSVDGRSQSWLAEEMTLRGLGWTRSTVAQLETGRRAIGLAEALALADAFGVPLAELVTPASPVQVGNGTWHPRFIAAAIDGAAVELSRSETYTSEAVRKISDSLDRIASRITDDLTRFRDRWGRMPARVELEIFDGAGRPEAAAARRLESRMRLGLAGRDVLAAARELGWGSLVEEQERRVRARSPEEPSQRTLQALRGLVAREMDKELAEVIERAADRAASKGADR